MTDAFSRHDPLEKQLELLFSDVALPKRSGVYDNGPHPYGAAVLAASSTPVGEAAIPLGAAQAWTRLYQIVSALSVMLLGLVLSSVVVIRMSGGIRDGNAPERSFASTASMLVSVAGSEPIPPAPERVVTSPARDLPASPSLAQVTRTRTLRPSQVPSGLTPSVSAATVDAAAYATDSPPAKAARAANSASTRVATSAATLTPLPTLIVIPTSTRPQEPGPTARPLPTAAPASPASDPAAPTRLVIAAIGLEAPVIAVPFQTVVIDGSPATTWLVPTYFAAGWHQSSAPPGQPGNTVLNGHQSIHGAVFRDLNSLQTDDEIIVYAGDSAYRYRVTERHLLQEEGQPLDVRMQNARWIMPTPDERLTLVTCAPDAQSTHRLIIVALPVASPVSPSAP
jgi:sortase A